MQDQVVITSIGVAKGGRVTISPGIIPGGGCLSEARGGHVQPPEALQGFTRPAGGLKCTSSSC